MRAGVDPRTLPMRGMTIVRCAPAPRPLAFRAIAPACTVQGVPCALFSLPCSSASPSQAPRMPRRRTRSTSRTSGSPCPTACTVVVHKDRKAPIVAVNIWYHVGRQDEPAGQDRLRAPVRTPDVQRFRKPQGRVFRARSSRPARPTMNGTTWIDRTNYFETVPTTALDMALWMESDRMGHLLGAIDQKELDEQRGVVQNEKRQGENQPMAASTNASWRIRSRPTIRTTTTRSVRWPISTPPRWMTSRHGSAAYYGAANDGAGAGRATSRGDGARRRCSKYFGDIPAGVRRWRASRPGWRRARQSTRDSMEDNVAQTRIYRDWNVPQLGNAGRRAARPRGRDPRRRQDVAPVPAAGLPGQAGRQRRRRRAARSRWASSSRCRPT